jgi:hypothetical protein
MFTTTGLQDNSGSFAQGTTNFVTYNSIYYKAKSDLYKTGITPFQAENQAHEFAMAYIMQQAGMTLLKKDTSGDFKRISASMTTENGKTTYTLEKCR